MLRTLGRRLALGLFILMAIGYALSGIYVVRVNETGVLKRFGRIVDGHIAPGLHYQIPWPVDKVVKVSTSEIHRFQAGFGAEPEQVAEYEQSYGPLAAAQMGSFIVPYCITGDKNILHVRVIAQYRIDDPKSYLIRFKAPENVALRCIQSAILSTLSRADVDTALTTGRVELQQQILKDVQRQLSALNTGITVFSTEIKNTRPPATVAQAFKDVINAREEHQTMIHDAEAYRNQIIPQGKAEASRILNEAEAYQAKKIAHAQGDSQRFVMLANEYKKDKETTGHRLYLEAVSEILPTVQKVVVGSDHGQDIANLKFFTQGRDEGDK
jgi:membrane protease subunit HflK